MSHMPFLPRATEPCCNAQQEQSHVSAHSLETTSMANPAGNSGLFLSSVTRYSCPAACPASCASSPNYCSEVKAPQAQRPHMKKFSNVSSSNFYSLVEVVSDISTVSNQAGRNCLLHMFVADNAFMAWSVCPDVC